MLKCVLKANTSFFYQVVRRHRLGVRFRIGFQMRKPGAVSSARFMQQALYLLKIAMLHGDAANRFNLSPEELSNVLALAEYTVLFFVPHYLQSRLAAGAPRMDRDLHAAVQRYQAHQPIASLNHTLAQAALESVERHLWYLTEECIVFSLFDEKLEEGERREIADQLLDTVAPAVFTTGKPQFPVMDAHVPPRLSTFVGPRSWVLFYLTGARSQWLQRPVQEWPLCDDYMSLWNMVRQLEVVNDGAERAIKDVTDYANVTKDENMRDDYIVVANCHRDIFHDLKRNALQHINLRV